MKIQSLSDFNASVNSAKKLFRPEDKYIIEVGTASCGVASGANIIYDKFLNEIKTGNISNVILKNVGCIGECYNEPVVVIKTKNNRFKYARVREDQVSNILNDIKTNNFIINIDESLQYEVALENAGDIDPTLIEDYLANEGYAALVKVLFSMSKDEVLTEIKSSGLRGRGGAGFPTGDKWEMVKNEVSDEKYIICNADEGDPGAFMDRAILEGDPHRVIEAMLIAGHTVGAKKGIIYIRKEYPLAVSRLTKAINDAYDRGFLGNNILGKGLNFDFKINLGAGAFVCGEETALIASIEGRRGEPKLKPPFPAIKGLFGKPTCINNVETFANITSIIRKGASWYKEINTVASPGTKVFSLAGKIKNEGLIEIPLGTTLRDVIYKIGGGIKDNKELKAIQTGGPAGGFIPKTKIDIKVDYDTLKEAGSIMGSGGMIIIDESDCIVDLVKFYVDFSVNESCGKCTPCRVGNKRMYEILDKITKGEASLEDLENLKELAITIKDTAFCGLGSNSPNPVLSSIENFYDEYLSHINDKLCLSGKCKHLTIYDISEEKCIGCSACAKVCPTSCIKGEPKKTYIINQEDCIKCGECFNKCPVDAISKGGKFKNENNTK